MQTEQQKAWHRFRARAIGTSIALAVIAGIGLLAIYHWEPSPVPSIQATQHGKLDPHLFAVLQTALTTLLSIALIALVFEVLLREAYAKDLLRFLRLRTALVTSGLQDVASAPDVEWAPILSGASKITALIRDPSVWLDPHLPTILNACQKRATTVLVGLPNPADPVFATIAASIGRTDAVLGQSIDVTVKSAENQWQSRKPHLDHGSTIRLVAFPGLLMYDVIVADDQIVCMFTRALGNTVGDYQLVLTFAQDKDAYPAVWLRQALNDLSKMNEFWAGDAS